MCRRLLRLSRTGPVILAFFFSALLSSHTGNVAQAGNSGSAVNQNEWQGYGRNAAEQHYSPLDSINETNVEDLGLEWFYDLPVAHSLSQPIAADGVLYTTTGHSYIRAFEATKGELLWEYDSKAAENSGHRLRQGYGSRGLAYWQGRVYIATHDGRLMALEGRTGKVLWSTGTLEDEPNAFITGAPRVYDGRVIIGFGGADGGGVRAYVSCYAAETGELLWRFFIVPGNPAVDKDETTMMVADTWNGEWWKNGGGGTAWNAIAYDPVLKFFYIGTGNGYPYNQQLRSPGGGDNLFLSSIVALDANSGRYVWHYQINPGEQWDYKATQDITLATLEIGEESRKVLMQAPTNGFFYVIDRTDGELISAAPYAKVTWASWIDLESGRPMEHPGARYHEYGELFEMWPSILGGHSWLPQSFSPETGLVYIPVIEKGMIIGDKGVDLSREHRSTNPENISSGMGITGDFSPELKGGRKAYLKAWDPVAQKARWSLHLPGDWPGGTMATGGNLVFQGRIDNGFAAYNAKTGERLWLFDTKSPVVAPPATYSINGRQYVTVITGSGGAGGGYHGEGSQKFNIDYRAQPRRVLTFTLGGARELPPAPEPAPLVAPEDPGFLADPALLSRGGSMYHAACGICHGGEGKASGAAPDLRISAIPASRSAFESVVRKGALVANGMPRFEDMPEADSEAIRHYLRYLGQQLPEFVKGMQRDSAESTRKKTME